ncbi:MAG: hypothetical protein Q4B28_03275 [bacterium]|nr:hypothetical protein [bacterium]
MKNYSITREKAAIALGVSTRTIDRYVKSGKLSYKKVANKVLLAKDEVESLREEFSALRTEVTTELIHEATPASQPRTSNPVAVRADLDQAIDEKIDRFFLIFKEKDKMIEEKNKIIFVLQQRIGELETKIQSMIALPDYTREKQVALIEKQKLEERIEKLKEAIRTEKIKSFILIILAFIFIGIAIFLLFRYKIIS